MTEEYEPHIVVSELLSSWTVEKLKNYDAALKRFFELEDKCDEIILARVLRKHVGPLYESIEEEDVGRMP